MIVASMDLSRDLVVFDIDGVLFDSERLTVEVEGVRDVVHALHQHDVPTCIASSGSHRKMELTLGLTGLRPLFEGRMYSASEVARGKPWPDLFVYAARSMGAEPSRCAVIEDSIYGARAAIAAGMICYGFAGSLTRRADLEATGATVFDTMAELRSLLLGTGCADAVHEAETRP